MYIFRMPYDLNTRDRIEAYPKKGTRAALLRKMKRKGHKTLSAYVNALLEGEAKRTNPETDAA